eukprot:TRINITY_DN9995_c0_g1_i1.p1 TRINITY_DN9995_c0_g1~~TRINITY_DN9995_c0_g1_i1.p1  ORF type:complete len:342 (-),score=60.53 TRINITY_DN9995_c0_g1_i1:168-1163(-)
MVGTNPNSVVVHPLVLLSVVDHYNRVAKDSKKRVVGVLLGNSSKGQVDITSSFAVPFEEDEKDPKIWFLDHSYLENMFRMLKKVNAREKIVGWYHTGPRLKECDLDINELISKFVPNPVLVICEVTPKELGLPIHGYCSIDEIKEDGTEKAKKVFTNILTEVGRTEAEEIGIEHLLRDVKDATVGTLSTQISAKLLALKGLASRLRDIKEYMDMVVQGTLPVNHEISYKLQDIFNLLPNMNVQELARSLTVKSNDMEMSIYLSSVIRTVIALHNLVENKEIRMAKEQEATSPPNSKQDKNTEENNADDKKKNTKEGNQNTSNNSKDVTTKK